MILMFWRGPIASEPWMTSPVKRQPLEEVSNLQEPQHQHCQQSAGQPIVVNEWTPSYNSDAITADRMTYKKLLTIVLSSCRQTIDFLMDAGIIDRRKSCTTCGADMNLVMSTYSQARGGSGVLREPSRPEDRCTPQ